MTQKHYYEARGALLTQLHDWFKQAETARRKMLAFAEQHGSSKVNIYGGSMSVTFALVFDNVPSNPVWKMKNDGWVPRRSTKAGKALAAEMEAIEKEYPTGHSIADTIGMKVFVGTAAGLAWRTPQMVLGGKDGEKVLLGVPDDYAVPKRLKGQLVRITDVAFEQLAAERQAPAKRSAKPRPKSRF